jgi:hypothetical protein
MGSFETWAAVVGGALENAGVTGFLADTTEWLEAGDPDADGWAVHLRELHVTFSPGKFTVAAVASRVESGYLELPYIRRDPDRSLAHTIGNAYRSVRGRWIGDYRLDSGPRDAANGARSWTVTSRDAP